MIHRKITFQTHKFVLSVGNCQLTHESCLAASATLPLMSCTPTIADSSLYPPPESSDREMLLSLISGTSRQDSGIGTKILVRIFMYLDNERWNLEISPHDLLLWKDQQQGTFVSANFNLQSYTRAQRSSRPVLKDK